ncbi:MAG: hypothetical protein ABI175_14500 [Polyangiales bacterium]
MTCRRVALVLALVVAGCAEDVTLLASSGTAGQSVTLNVPTNLIPDDLTTFRWELVTAPDGSVTGGPHGDAASSSFIPDLRGVYLVDRWLVEDLAERLTHHIVVTVGGVPPEASIRGDGIGAVGAASTLDGTSSHSLEARALTYRWRLAMRPAASQTALAANDTERTTVIPDGAGDYVVELDVFDGELWSALPASFTVMAH